MRQWESQINRLIKESAQRRVSERNVPPSLSRLASTTNSTNPRQPSAWSHEKTNSTSSSSNTQSLYVDTLPSNPSNGRRRLSPYPNDEQENRPTYGLGPQGYPPHEGFDVEPDEDEFEDYPPTNNYAASGRGTPMGRRVNAMSMPPERDAVPGYDRPRAQTEDTNGPVMAQWRNNNMPPPLPPSGPQLSSRPITPRLPSNMSGASEASFGNGVRPKPSLRSQFSSTKLRTAYDVTDSRSKTPSPAVNGNVGLPTLSRSRSASQPNAYVPKSIPPPMPTTSQVPWTQQRTTSRTTTSLEHKRGSGSSESTGSSDYSPNSSSPITPFGSSESSLARSQESGNGASGHFASAVKVKVHYHEDIFVIQVPRVTEFDDLVEKVGKKIRLCGPRREDGPLRVKYRDEDGDMVSLGSTEDVQMAFEQYRPGGQVVLFVT